MSDEDKDSQEDRCVIFAAVESAATASTAATASVVASIIAQGAVNVQIENKQR